MIRLKLQLKRKTELPAIEKLKRSLGYAVYLYFKKGRLIVKPDGLCMVYRDEWAYVSFNTKSGVCLPVDVDNRVIDLALFMARCSSVPGMRVAYIRIAGLKDISDRAWRKARGKLRAEAPGVLRAIESLDLLGRDELEGAVLDGRKIPGMDVVGERTPCPSVYCIYVEEDEGGVFHAIYAGSTG